MALFDVYLELILLDIMGYQRGVNLAHSRR